MTTLPDVVDASRIDAVVDGLQDELDALEAEYHDLRADIDRYAEQGADAILELILSSRQERRARELRDAAAAASARVQAAQAEADRIVAAAVAGMADAAVVDIAGARPVGRRPASPPIADPPPMAPPIRQAPSVTPAHPGRVAPGTHSFTHRPAPDPRTRVDPAVDRVAALASVGRRPSVLDITGPEDEPDPESKPSPAPTEREFWGESRESLTRAHAKLRPLIPLDIVLPIVALLLLMVVVLSWIG